MTKADLIEEVSRVVEMTRKESEVIVESIFDSIVKALRGGGSLASDAIQKPAPASRFPPRRFLTSSPAKNLRTWSTIPPRPRKSPHRSIRSRSRIKDRLAMDHLWTPWRY